MNTLTETLSILNDAQQAAVTAELGHHVVLAGAGSGKTRVLVHRIAWLIENRSLSPFNILAVTFTNKAAKEMKYRIESMIGMSANAMWVGTFHGIAHRLLRAHWKEAGLSQNFQILDSEDQHRLVKRVIRELELDEAKWPPKQAQWFINKQKDKGLRSDQTPSGDHFQTVMKKIYDHYEEATQKNGLIDFGDLLLSAYELLRDNPHVLAHYQQRFQYILIDEFQDTNTLQYEWLRLLAGKTAYVMIVGDDDQSIYSWRGAQVENIRRFERDFKNTCIIRLEQNYRSTGNILKAANQLIANNNGRLGKNLWTESSDGDVISLYAAFNELDEARFIVDRIKTWIKDGGRPSECAVLYRSNAQSRILEEAFLQAAVPYRIYGGQRFYERAEIKDALAYMRLINHRDDDPSFERIINTPTRGVGNRTIEIIRDHARTQGGSLWHAATDIVTEELLPSRAHTAVCEFIELINAVTEHIDGKSLAEQIEYTIRNSGLLTHYQKEKTEKGRARVENLEELVNAAQQFSEDDIIDGQPILSAFLSHAALEAGEGQSDQFSDCAQLMTLHSAKGLEFPLVFIAGLEEGLFPHQMSLEEPHGLAEERRLCYVGMTRAMQKLYLCYAEVRSLYGRERRAIPSRFIYEIPIECLEEVRMRSRISIPVSQVRKTPSFIKTENEGQYRIGQAVKHGKFGNGVILNIEGSGNKARLQIHFKKTGSKWLVAELAKLEALS